MQDLGVFSLWKYNIHAFFLINDLTTSDLRFKTCLL